MIGLKSVNRLLEYMSSYTFISMDELDLVFSDHKRGGSSKISFDYYSQDLTIIILILQLSVCE